ncbi:type II secretion system protein [Alkalibacillus silvisoli]|uniref:Prepilin-type N-terminal cleavage/methylation domain-containing protein n=1 Tax=Alkalibacillus silvisoli TaxID=392823 RepID=A0ABP3JGJ8_9BACI
MLKKIFKNQKGITLVELLAVIVILGIIALIAVPAIANVIEDSRYDSVKATGINIIEAAELYSVTNNVEDGGVDLADLTGSGYLEGSSLDDWSGDTAVTINSDGANTLSGTGTDGNVSVTFSSATVEEINNTDASDLRQGEASGDVTQGS